MHSVGESTECEEAMLLLQILRERCCRRCEGMVRHLRRGRRSEVNADVPA
jgi:hypothetical protein